MLPHFSCSWPLFDDHMECEKWSNFKNIAFFEFHDQKNVCFDMPQVYRAIKNHRIHVTTFFMFMTTIWWPHGVWKLVKLKKYCLFELPDQKNVCFDMPQRSFFSKFRSGNRWGSKLWMDFCFKPHQNRFINDQNIEKDRANKLEKV